MRLHRYFFAPRELGAFQRSFRMPPDAASDEFHATFRNAVLNITIPKLQPAVNGGRRVAVRAE